MRLLIFGSLNSCTEIYSRRDLLCPLRFLTKRLLINMNCFLGYIIKSTNNALSFERMIRIVNLLVPIAIVSIRVLTVYKKIRAWPCFADILFVFLFLSDV